MSAMPSGLVERLLADRIGLDPSSVGDGLIARGVHARMASRASIPGRLRAGPDRPR